MKALQKYLLGGTLHETLMEVTMAIGRPIPPLHLSSENGEPERSASNHCPGAGSAIPDRDKTRS